MVTNTNYDELKGSSIGDLIRVAINRGESRSWNSMSKADLITFLGPLSSHEKDLINSRIATRIPFNSYTTKILTEYCMSLGISMAGSKTDLIDRLIEKCAATNIPASVNDRLDDSQVLVVDSWASPRLIIDAGPGSGKTTTLCALVGRILTESPKARILILAFNREAVKVLTSRIRTIRPKILSRKCIHKAYIPQGQCGVRTFNVFAAKVVGYENLENVCDHKFDADIANAAIILNNKPTSIDWEWVIIDEGQDVQMKHVPLVDAIVARTTHFVVAGDPRQELYTGAVWFSRLCTSSDPSTTYCRLTHNHRSHPQIVALLNAFSACAFPSLHYDQIAAREDVDGLGVFVAHHDLKDPKAAETIVKFLGRQGIAGKTYAITPVTTQKFNMSPMTMRLRQLIYEEYAWPVKAIDGGTSSLQDVCVIGNSYVLKGTERASVAVYGGTVGYEEYGIANAVKLVYVALSRAQDELFVLLDKTTVVPNSAAAALFKACIQVVGCTIVPQIRKREKKTPVSLTVTDLCKLLRRAPLASGETMLFDPVVLPESIPLIDSDFRGLYVESKIANALGVDLTTTYSNVEFYNDKITSCIVGGFIIVDGEAKLAVPRSLEYLVCATKSCTTSDLSYVCAQAGYSFTIKKAWTVSSILTDSLIPSSTQSAKKAIQLKAHGTKKWCHQQPLFLGLSYHRCTDPSNQKIKGIADICGMGDQGLHTVIEVKHAHSLPVHARQAAIYATLAGVDKSFVLNTLTGSISGVKAYSIEYLNDAARAILALKEGNAVDIPRVRCLAFETHTIAVIIDIEYLPQGFNPPVLLEIGAVAFGCGDTQYVDHLHILAPGISDLPSDNVPVNFNREIEMLVGLDLSPEAIEKAVIGESHLIRQFHDWIASLGDPQSLIVVHWGGSDTKILDCEDMFDTCNLMHIFKASLRTRGYKEAKICSLQEAAANLLGPLFKFAPHRAYEDSIATAAIAVALIELGGER
jgi:hypothetical protein